MNASGTRSGWARPAIVVLLSWFALRLIALALTVDAAVPPDEATHLGRIAAWAGTWGVPAHGPSNWEHGLLWPRPAL